MSDKPPPRRPSSLEMTAVIPREHLPPVAPLIRERASDPDAITSVPCPRCEGCPLCLGTGLAAPDDARAYREAEKKLATLDEPGTEE